MVDQILKYIEPILEYQREGGLYTAEMEVSDFIRPGAQQ